MFRMISIGLVICLAWPGAGLAEELLVGAAAVKITPPPGTPMAGYYHPRGAEGVHDELYAKVIVLQQGEVKAALVGLDVIGVDAQLVTRAREQIEQSTGLRGDHVMISATHTHTGRQEKLGAAGELAKQYTDSLPKLIAQGAQQAQAALAPAGVSAAVGREESIAFNRRFHMKDGSVGWNPGKLNANIVKPAGPIDPDVSLVYFQSPDRKPLACYVNYAVHLDNVGGLQISADLPYTLSKCLASSKDALPTAQPKSSAFRRGSLPTYWWQKAAH